MTIKNTEVTGRGGNRGQSYKTCSIGLTPGAGLYILKRCLRLGDFLKTVIAEHLFAGRNTQQIGDNFGHVLRTGSNYPISMDRACSSVKNEEEESRHI